MFTPEAVYSNSSSNRSTAVVQLDSDKSGRVLVQEYIQEKLSRYMEQLFKIMLEYKGIAGKVWINFNPIEIDGQYLEDPNQTPVEQPANQEETIRTENGTISTSKPGDGLRLQNIRNTQRGATIVSP